MKDQFEFFLFHDDGIIPNNYLPVIIYFQVTQAVDKSEWFEKRFQQNGWTNNWRDIVLSYDHFHSTTHEVLGVGKGNVVLQLGGMNGKIFTVSAGDAIILPAGTGHSAFKQDEHYEIVGGYPDGKTWDMCTGLEDDRISILNRIKNVSIPALDPVFGLKGQLPVSWR
jgi:uncharacterized protein YjlB